MRVLRPAASVLFLTLTLGAPCLAAARSTAPAAPPTTPRVAERGDLLVELRTFFVSLWKAAGCRLDPFGHCVPDTQGASPKLPTGDAGCQMDPWGRCAPGATAPRIQTIDAGCEIDPFGRCTPHP